MNFCIIGIGRRLRLKIGGEEEVGMKFSFFQEQTFYTPPLPFDHPTKTYYN